MKKTLLFAIIFTLLMCPLMAMPTPCFFGEEGVITYTTVNGSNADGWIEGYATTWAVAHGSTPTGKTSGTADGADALRGAMGYYYPANWYCDRDYLYFDTSGLPDNASVTAVTMTVYGHLGGNTTTQNIWQAFAGTQADSLTTADWNAFGEAWSNTQNVPASNGAVTFTFNAAGIAGINLTGLTKVCLRDYTYDVGGTQPPYCTPECGNNITFSDSSTNKPSLYITYVAP
jgi:hypothetical protein